MVGFATRCYNLPLRMAASLQQRRWPWTRVGLAALLVLTATAGSCSQEARQETTPARARVEAPDLPRPDLRLLVLTDLEGYLEPCGCTSRPLGGIDRLAARLGEVRRDGAPTVLVAAGNLFFHGALEGAEAERARAQEVWRAETVSDVLARLDLAAAAPGPLDFAFGTETFEALAARAPFPLLAAGLELTPGETPPSEPPLVPTTTVRAGSLDVGLVGLSDLRGPDGTLPERVEERAALREAGREAVRALREGGADLVIALVRGDRRTARQVATGIEGIDFVVQGGVDEPEPIPPAEAGGAVLLHAGRQGQGVTVVDLWRRGDGEWTDASMWTREEQREHLAERIEALERRIAEWEADEGVQAADLAAQRARLERLRAEAAALLRAPRTEGKNVLSARYEELGPEARRERSITELLARYDRRVNEHNRTALADWLPEPAPEGHPSYVGSQACASCHGAAVRWWRETKHGRAYATLEEQNKNFNLSCVGCHVTGYLQPGGSTAAHVENLENVGCESCHGPGSMHVADPSGAAVNVVRSPEASTCVGCHNEEHSDRFHFDTYRRLLIAPGHGMPAE